MKFSKIAVNACGKRRMTDSTVGATPGQDLSGLLQPNLNTTELLNLAETEAIDIATSQHIDHARKKKRTSKWLTDTFIRKVHHDMFGTIWDWAGIYRTRRLSIGIEPYQIPEQINLLCGDFEIWNSPSSTMPVLELAARLQQRLTKIHPFKDGNGRHARLMTDIFLHSRDHPSPKWPQIHRLSQGDVVRTTYIAALKEADNGSYNALANLFNEWLK
jgi:Fic-DOC domain mobile mystery protein B